MKSVFFMLTPFLFFSSNVFADYCASGDCQNGYGTVVINSSGESANGTMKGTFTNGQLNGYGEYYWDNGHEYKGQFRNTARHGWGTYKWPGNNQYVGEWENNEINGEGTFDYGIGGYYQGHWLNGIYHGNGLKEWPNGDKYKGNWQQGRQSGYGTFWWANKNVYQGEWLNDEFEGTGTFWWSKGAMYKGEWHKNLRHGQGFLKWDDGATYNGAWFNGQRDGYGNMIWANKANYNGEWSSDKRNGQGTMRYVDDEFYQGNWESDLRSGEGYSRMPNGDVYQGMFKDDLRNGYGKLTSYNSLSIESVWEGGEPTGHSISVDPNGNRYFIPFANGAISGPGLIEYKNGDFTMGTYSLMDHSDPLSVTVNGETIEYTESTGTLYMGETQYGNFKGDVLKIDLKEKKAEYLNIENGQITKQKNHPDKGDKCFGMINCSSGSTCFDQNICVPNCGTPRNPRPQIQCQLKTRKLIIENIFVCGGLEECEKYCDLLNNSKKNECFGIEGYSISGIDHIFKPLKYNETLKYSAEATIKKVEKIRKVRKSSIPFKKDGAKLQLSWGNVEDDSSESKGYCCTNGKIGCKCSFRNFFDHGICKGIGKTVSVLTSGISRLACKIKSNFNGECDEDNGLGASFQSVYFLTDEECAEDSCCTPPTSRRRGF